jgi:hypothetical protein
VQKEPACRERDGGRVKKIKKVMNTKALRSWMCTKSTFSPVGRCLFGIMLFLELSTGFIENFEKIFLYPKFANSENHYCKKTLYG